MKLRIGANELSLPRDFELTINKVHPFYSDEGEASTAVTLPYSPDNLRLLDNPERIRRTSRGVRIHDGAIQAGIMHKRCKIITDSATDRGGGVSASVALSESKMYIDFQDLRLKDIFAGKDYAQLKGGSYAFPEVMYNVKVSDRDSYSPTDVVAFSVAVDKDSDGNYSMLNAPDGNGAILYKARTVAIDGEDVDMPLGYGVTPFLYLWALVEYTFTLSGYTVDKNFLTSEPWSDLVVVHNTADSVADAGGDGFNYADLVPNITVGDLITFLRDTFGAYVTYDEDRVCIRLISNIIDLNPDADLTKYARKGITVTYPEPKALVRSLDTSIDDAEPAEDNLVDFRASYSTLAEVDSVDDITSTGLFHVPAMGAYYYKNSADSDTERLGSECFEYRRKYGEEMDDEEVSSEANYLPMVEVDGIIIPYIGERIHRHLDLEDTDADADQPIQLCWAHWSDDLGHYCGSSHSYFEDGSQTTYSVWKRINHLYVQVSSPYPSLTPEGLSDLWSDYESMLANSAPEITVTFDLPLHILLSLDWRTKKVYDHCQVLVKSLNYTIRQSGGTIEAEATLQVLPSYSDALEAGDVSFGTSYVWARETSFDTDVTRWLNWTGTDVYYADDGVEDYTDDDAPSTAPTYYGQITMKRTRCTYYKNTFMGVTSIVKYTWKEWFAGRLSD